MVITQDVTRNSFGIIYRGWWLWCWCVQSLWNLPQHPLQGYPTCLWILAGYRLYQILKSISFESPQFLVWHFLRSDINTFVSFRIQSQNLRSIYVWHAFSLSLFSVCVCVCVCVCVFISQCVSLSLSLSLSVCLPLCVYVSLIVFVSLSVSVGLSVCVSLCVCLSQCVYVSLSQCVSVTLSLSVCVFFSLSFISLLLCVS